MLNVEISKNQNNHEPIEFQDNIPLFVQMYINFFRIQLDDIWIPSLNERLFIDINPIQYEFYEKSKNATNIHEINSFIAVIKNNEILSKVTIGNREFFLTRVFSSRRKECLAFTIINNEKNNSFRIEPRLFYKSNSEGSWRVTDAAKHNNQQGIYYGKGLYPHTGLYSFETRISNNLEAALENLDNKNTIRHLSFNSRKYYDSLIDFFYNHNEFSTINQRMKNDYKNEISLISPPSFEDYQNQLELYMSLLENPDNENILLEKIINDPNDYSFINNDYLKTTYTEKHELLGDSLVYVFSDFISCDNEPLEWHISYHQRTNTIQVKKIDLTNNKISSFGNNLRFIDPGILTTKAIDYKSQNPESINLVEKLNFSNFGMQDDDTLRPLPKEYYTYITTRPLLENFKVIKKFREFINVPENQ